VNEISSPSSFWREFLSTLAGKVSALSAFVLLMTFMLSVFGADIPGEYRPLMYVMGVGAVLVGALSTFIALLQVLLRRRQPSFEGGGSTHSKESYRASLRGSGAIAQGPGATAVGKGGKIVNHQAAPRRATRPRKQRPDHSKEG